MKIRLMGTEDECRQVVARLPEIVDVLEISEPRANRGASRLVRVYVECRPIAPARVRATTRVVRELPQGDADA